MKHPTSPDAMPERPETARCRQCGEYAWVTVIRRRRHRVRYWCQRCGAVVSTGVGELFRPDPAPAAPEPATLRTVMPAAMVEWIGGHVRREITVALLDKSTMYELYQSWDRHRAAAGEDRLPAFATVVGTLHDTCYRLDVALAAIADAGPEAALAAVTAAAPQALRERAGHARAWLASHPSMCWIRPDAGPDDLVAPEHAAVRAAAEALGRGDEPDQGAAWAARAAMFGVDGGPTLRKLRRAYPVGQMVAALDAYLDAGDRPLRRLTLAALAGTDPTPAGSASTGSASTTQSPTRPVVAR